MKKILLIFLLVSVVATPAMAGFESCLVAEKYGWHSGFHNAMCFWDIMNDIFDVDLVTGDLDDVVGTPGNIENTKAKVKQPHVIGGKR